MIADSFVLLLFSSSSSSSSIAFVIGREIVEKLVELRVWLSETYLVYSNIDVF